MTRSTLRSITLPARGCLWAFGILFFLLVCCPPVEAVDFLDDSSYEATTESEVPDPLEPLNRVFFDFNDKFYLWVLDPVATGYSTVLPQDIRGCVDNFFNNLAEPVRAANCLLQGRLRDTGVVLTRFVLNSVFGVFGLADTAAHEFKLPPVHAAFGETLGVWGLGDGLYLVVPFFGPSTARDFLGVGVDSFAKTLYFPGRDNDEVILIMGGIERINLASLHLGEYQDMKSLSFDPYVGFRSGYFQLRDKRRQPVQASETHE